MFGKTLGVIGTGNIGRTVISIAKGFSMNVAAFDVKPDTEYAKENGFEYVDLNELLKVSDIATIHVPYFPSTKHLINKEKLSLMKKTAYLINTARGEIVNTKDLVEALDHKVIAGAGLDVLEGERELKEELHLLTDDFHDIDLFQTLLADHKLIDMDNAIVTPHIAFNTVEAIKNIHETTLQNILAFKSGNSENIV